MEVTRENGGDGSQLAAGCKCAGPRCYLFPSFSGETKNPDVDAETQFLNAENG